MDGGPGPAGAAAGSLSIPKLDIDPRSGCVAGPWPDGTAVELAAEPVFGWVQVFTTEVYDTDEGRIDAVAVEPMTCPADAFNSGTDLLHLGPGEHWSAGWSLAGSA